MKKEKYCYYFSKETDFMKKYNDFIEKEKKCMKEAIKYIREVFNLAENEVAWSNHYDILVIDKIVKIKDLSKKFIIMSGESFSVYDEKKIYLGQWAKLKRNTKEWKKIAKIYKDNQLEYNPLNITNLMYHLFDYNYYGKVQKAYLDEELYIVSDGDISKYEYIKKYSKEIEYSELMEKLNSKKEVL